MRYVAVLFSLCLMTGCATLIHGSDQEVQITSDPSTAQVEVNGRPIGETPTSATLERNRSYTVKIYREGFETHTTTLRRGWSLWTSANLFNFLLPGLLIDASTGAFYSLQPGEISADLDSVRSSADTTALGPRMDRPGEGPARLPGSEDGS